MEHSKTESASAAGAEVVADGWPDTEELEWPVSVWDRAGVHDVATRDDDATGAGPASFTAVRTWRVALAALGAGLVLGLGSGLVLRGWLLHELSAPSPAAVAVVSGNGTSAVPVNFILVDVHGDVQQPGVYRLPEDARVEDAIKAAGGFRHGEDAAAVNGAQMLTDGMEVVVPDMSTGAARSTTSTNEPAGSAGQAPEGSAVATGTRIDLNTASTAALETLPGIGPAKAQAIIAYRTAHGGFRSVDELLQVPGIGPATLAKIRPFAAILSR